MPFESNIGVLSVVPSPYQRDLFQGIARGSGIDIDVFYQSADSIDNPWPEATLMDHEHLVPGRRISYGSKRAYVNWGLPDFSEYDLTVLNVSYFSPVAQWLMRRKLKNVSWIFWGERMRQQPSWWRRMGQELVTAPLRSADALVGIGSLAVEAYRRSFPKKQVYNIPYFCDLSDFVEARQRSESDGPLTILFCGQMIERKGIDLLLKAFDRLVKENEDVKLRLLGREAELSEMWGLVGPEAQNRIDVLGFRPPEELPALFGSADIFVLPSRHDGWGVVVNQALGAGLPILCSDAVGAAHDLVEPGRNGMRVSAGAVQPLYEALKRVTTNPQLRSEWADESRSMAEEWSLDEGVSRWVRVARELTSGTPDDGETIFKTEAGT